MDVSIDQLIVRSAGSTSSTIRKLITSTFPGRLRSVYFDVVPDQRRYYSSDLSNHLLVSAAENGVDGFYTPRILPIDQFAYDIDVNAVVDFCLRRRPCRGHRVFGGSFLKIIAPDLSRFLWVMLLRGRHPYRREYPVSTVGRFDNGTFRPQPISSMRSVRQAEA